VALVTKGGAGASMQQPTVNLSPIPFHLPPNHHPPLAATSSKPLLSPAPSGGAILCCLVGSGGGRQFAITGHEVPLQDLGRLDGLAVGGA
jgi:hypothetical protein